MINRKSRGEEEGKSEEKKGAEDNKEKIRKLISSKRKKVFRLHFSSFNLNIQ